MSRSRNMSSRVAKTRRDLTNTEAPADLTRVINHHFSFPKLRFGNVGPLETPLPRYAAFVEHPQIRAVRVEQSLRHGLKPVPVAASLCEARLLLPTPAPDPSSRSPLSGSSRC